MNSNFSAHFFLLLVYFFIQYHWKACFNSCQDFCLSFWNSFSTQLLLLFVYFLFNITEKLILTCVKTFIYSWHCEIFIATYVNSVVYFFFIILWMKFFVDVWLYSVCYLISQIINYQHHLIFFCSELIELCAHMHIYLYESLSEFFFCFIKLIWLVNFQILLSILFLKLLNACLHLCQDLSRTACQFCHIWSCSAKSIRYHNIFLLKCFFVFF